MTSYEDLSLEQVREEARLQGIGGFATLEREELMALLHEQGAVEPQGSDDFKGEETSFPEQVHHSG
jgi:hypothetical protein